MIAIPLAWFLARPVVFGPDEPIVSRGAANRAALTPAIIQQAGLSPGSARGILGGCRLVGGEWHCTIQKQESHGLNCTADIVVPSSGEPKPRVERRQFDPVCRS